jgi:hypothetical protein
MIIYTVATISFYLLGAAVLHGKGVRVTDEELIASLSHMYRASFGPIGLWFFVLGAFSVLYSTVFVSTASNGRLCIDLLRLLRRGGPAIVTGGQWQVRVASTLLPVVYLTLYLFVKRPLSLVLVGAVAQAVMLPLLCGAALYFHHHRCDPQLRSSRCWTVLLWTASLLMTSAGLFELGSRLAALRSG